MPEGDAAPRLEKAAVGGVWERSGHTEPKRRALKGE